MKTIPLLSVVLLLCVRAQATTITTDAVLSGPNESPANASPGTGFATVTFDDVANTMQVDVSFSGLVGTTTASHIHAPTVVAGTGTAGVATTTPYFTGFPIGVTSGIYSHLYDMTLASSYNPSYVTANGGVAGAEAALFSSIVSGKAYLNIHTTFVPSGEIRGFLIPAPDTASTLGLLALGVSGLFGAARFRSLQAI